MIGRLTKEEIEGVLHSYVLGRTGCNDGKKTCVVPLNYIYDGRQVIANSAEGMKIRIMRKNPSICFEVDKMKSFTNWKSVIALEQYHGQQDWQKNLKRRKIPRLPSVANQ